MTVVLVVVAAACGNAKQPGASPSTADKVAAPTDGGAAHRNTHHAISGVPGVTDKAINYAVVGTKQGNPLGTCILDCYVAGIKAYFAYRNSQGGVYGRKLEVGQVSDDQLANNETLALSIISGKKAFGTFQGGLLQQGWGDLNNAGVPTYTWGIDGTSAANRPAIFPSTVIRCGNCTAHTVPYAAMIAKAHTAGVLGYSTSQNSKDCADATGASFKLYSKDTGVKLGYLKDDLPYGLTNGIGPEVSAMKKAGVDFIATCFDLNAMKTLAQELKRQGMSNVVLFHPNTYNQDFVKAAGNLFQNSLVEVQFRPFEDGHNAALTAFKTWRAKQHSEISELAMDGWINATLAYDGLLAAGPDFNQAKVIAGTNAITDFTAGGLVPGVDWRSGHTPYTNATRTTVKDTECITMVKVVNGVFHPVGSTAKPWSCWDQGNLAWAKPTPTNFR
ncbi:MAG TPA: ABC transporter substrate-binding protein [Acidimicrobiales bacterium]